MSTKKDRMIVPPFGAGPGCYDTCPPGGWQGLNRLTELASVRSYLEGVGLARSEHVSEFMVTIGTDYFDENLVEAVRIS